MAKSILIATTLGKGGKGGIDRIMDSVRSVLLKENIENIKVQFGVTRGKGHIFISPFFVFAFILKMIFLKIVNQCDLVHLNVSNKGSTYRKIIIAKFAIILGIKYIIHLHGSAYDHYYANEKQIFKKAIMRFFQQASSVVVLGNVWKEFVINTFFISTDSVYVIYNASESLSSASKSTGSRVVNILFLGRLGSRKGVPQLIDALFALRELPNWYAIIAGDGEVSKFRRKVETCGLEKCISVPGWVGPVEAKSLLFNADILVLPSFAENLPMSVIEGMGAGLAIITTSVGAIADVIENGKSGILVSPGNVGELADAIKKLVENENLRKALGNSAYEYHRTNLEITAYTNKLLQIWKHS